MFLTNIQQKNGMSMYIHTVNSFWLLQRGKRFALLMARNAKKWSDSPPLTYATFCHRLRQGPPEDSCG